MAEAKCLALRLAKDRGLTYINGYDHPNIIAGQGTIGCYFISILNFFLVCVQKIK